MMRLTYNRVAASRLLALVTLLAALLAAFVMLTASQAHATTTFTVINTNDSGAGSLRQAILDANNTPGADVINFNISGSEVHTISPTSPLPTITEAVSINGYSQPGASANTKAVGSDAILKIELSGANATNAYHGLKIGASNSTVKGLVINRWGFGIHIDGSGATSNKITGNYIGTNASGTQSWGNGTSGVYIYEASNNTVGGATAAARNVVSGIGAYGVSIDGSGATGNKVAGNYVGTDATGTKDLGNNSNGVSIHDRAHNNTVGGATAGERNVVSGNGSDGVEIFYGATGNKVAGNYVGADKNGAALLGNSDYGVYIYGAPGNTIGGTTAGESNVITDTDYNGVTIDGADADGNRVLSNSIFANAGLGIDLGDDGPTPNDLKDADTGPNGLQNNPVLSSARTGSTTTTVRGTLNSTPSKTFTVRFFSNPSGENEGRVFIGQRSVTTDGSGNATFTFSPASKVGLGRTITATATDAAGNTSEFSAPRKVVSA